MDFNATVAEFYAEVKASIADRYITVEEAGKILTRAASVFSSAASFLGNTGPEKKALVMAALTKGFDMLVPFLPLGVRAVLSIPGVRSLVLAALAGVVESIYQRFVKVPA